MDSRLPLCNRFSKPSILARSKRRRFPGSAKANLVSQADKRFRAIDDASRKQLARRLPKSSTRKLKFSTLAAGEAIRSLSANQRVSARRSSNPRRIAVSSPSRQSCQRSFAFKKPLLTISAAAEGVSARKSAAKSDKTKSIWCPTAEITGTGHAAISRIKVSSLNAHKSSTLPPPRPMTTRSKSFSSREIRNPSSNSTGASSPCTLEGTTITSPRHPRRLKTLMKSFTAAPVGEVTKAMRRGMSGI